MDSEHEGFDGIDEELNRAADAIERAAGMIDDNADPIEVLDVAGAEDPEPDFLQEEAPIEIPAEDAYDDVRADASDTVRSEVIILFSDIEGSTSYFERKGDEEGLAMVQHHNDLLFPVIENEGGRVVKTIGDGIMACFKDPVSAVKAAIGMQQALEADRAMTFDADEHIHIRVALHMGPGIEKDNDVYGDVVNAAAKVQQQAQPDQILITEVLRESAKQAGAQCAKLGRAEMKGKDEALDVYAVAWSALASEQLIAELQARYEEKIRELRKEKDHLEEELETSGEQWRAERRRLTGEIEGLEAEVESAKESVGLRSSEDLQAQVRFQLEEVTRVKEQLEQELTAAQGRWEVERKRLQAQVDSLQGAALEAMAQTNNPARLALAIRDQVDARLKDAKEQWQMQWEGERSRLLSEIERLKNAVSAAPLIDERESARRGLLQKLGKGQAEPAPVTAGWGGGGKTPQQWESEFREAKARWELERDQLTMKVKQLEREGQLHKDSIRQEVFQELRGQYEPRLESYERERKRLKDDLEAVTAQLAEERQRLTARIEHLERSLPEAQEAARTQVIAELRADYEMKMEEINRLRARSERRSQDALEESEAALRRAKKEIARLQEELKEAKEMAFRARKVRSSSASTPNL
jgi:class 3 adenylate cyclase